MFLNSSCFVETNTVTEGEGQMKKSNTNKQKGLAMLDKLKNYKEMITIMLFFVSGFIWLDSQYPKKVDLKQEIASVQCILDKYMMLTQLQIHGQELEKQVTALRDVIKITLPYNTDAIPLSPAMKYEIDEKKKELTGKKNDFKQNYNKIKQISGDLARNVCGRLGL